MGELAEYNIKGFDWTVISSARESEVLGEGSHGEGGWRDGTACDIDSCHEGSNLGREILLRLRRMGHKKWILIFVNQGHNSLS
jgi:hypothetical protein